MDKEKVIALARAVIDTEARAAQKVAERIRVNVFPVVDEQHRLVGAINMHDLLRAGVV